MVDLKIIKRQGGSDEWSDDKIITSILRAGASAEEAQDVAKGVRDWAEKNSDEGHIKSIELRDQIIKQLKKINSLAANTFQVYKK